VVAALANPNFPDTADRLRELQEAAPKLGKQIQVVNAASASEIDAAFARFAQRRPDALIVVTDLFMTARRYHLSALAMRYAFPAIYAEREQVLAGGLISYSTSITEATSSHSSVARGRGP
jgi:putative tryptophan/tyrosine transport system substrate-binding protein